MRFTHELMMCSKFKNHDWCWFSAVRSWTGVPFWYMLLRWGLFLALLMLLWIIIKCAESWSKGRKRRGRLDGIWRFHCSYHNPLMIDEKKKERIIIKQSGFIYCIPACFTTGYIEKGCTVLMLQWVQINEYINNNHNPVLCETCKSMTQ